MYKLWTAAHYDWFTSTCCRSMPFSFRLFLECVRYCDWSIAQILSIHSLHSCIRCLKTCKVNECKTFGVACFRITHYLKKKTMSGVNTVHTHRILHGCVEIWNFSSSVEKYFTSERSEREKNFFNTIREILYLQAAM